MSTLKHLELLPSIYTLSIYLFDVNQDPISLCGVLEQRPDQLAHFCWLELTEPSLRPARIYLSKASIEGKEKLGELFPLWHKFLWAASGIL